VYMATCGCARRIVLARDGTVRTCSDGSDGALGLGDVLDRWVLTRIAPEAFGGAEIVFVADGSEESFALTTEGVLYTWGT